MLNKVPEVTIYTSIVIIYVPFAVAFTSTTLPEGACRVALSSGLSPAWRNRSGSVTTVSSAGLCTAMVIPRAAARALAPRSAAPSRSSNTSGSGCRNGWALSARAATTGLGPPDQPISLLPGVANRLGEFLPATARTSGGLQLSVQDRQWGLQLVTGIGDKAALHRPQRRTGQQPRTRTGQQHRGWTHPGGKRSARRSTASSDTSLPMSTTTSTRRPSLMWAVVASEPGASGEVQLGGASENLSPA
jgi:hypothetical protein